ncbi:MAG: translational GTPase TypA [Candidatus Paracaedimonas acanthamoebae]|uniref:Large ribosomal subunit assembly factor BipA n=1 Tax=Candidatus Paracaedimonas acanthamoebae TaxID=244581 RepID=A0A8J7PZV0_9PROT|nr:translational GTPase TypA [Candidatus Paracaedimonas acanthamoebae]
MIPLRNLAIIAHVDHGKTTLVDSLFRQSGIFRENQNVAERAMDSNDLERERGITILAKCTSIVWNDVRLNIVDTPGHADFGGEVERILSMVDGVVLLVDAAEGPMPQTKFVVMKALKLGLRPIVVVNKADRPDARADEVLNEIFDLFVTLDANEKQLDFPVIYASGRDGWAARHLTDPRGDLTPLFETIIDFIPAPNVDHEAPFSMLVTTLEVDPYLGRILTGRVQTGVARLNMPVKALRNISGESIENGRLSKILAFRGLKREPVEEAFAGDIIAVAGLEQTTVADTICVPEVMNPIPALPIDPPTLMMTFSINDSPLAGREGKKVTSRMIRERLLSEAESNVAIQIKESEDKDSFEVAGRGELQLGILIETMRREGFELSISRPRVVYKADETTGQRLEPIEEVQIDVDEEFSGVVVEKMGFRKAEMKDMRPSGGGKTRITFHAPSRGLIGYQSEFMTDTRGTGILSRLFHSYAPYKGAIVQHRNGVLISVGAGKAVAYAIFNLEDRGIFFINPGDEVYEGMVIGEYNRQQDLEVNPLKAKQLSNVRAAGKDEAIRLTPPKILTLEQALSYIEDDELVEVTPKSIRLRKRYLDPNERKRFSRSKEE